MGGEIQGSPIATVVESGNGFIRFGDGTQICYGFINISGYNNNNHTITFARPFKDVNYGFSTVPLYSGNYETAYACEKKANSNSATDHSRTTSSVVIVKTISTSWLAIGRWK